MSADLDQFHDDFDLMSPYFKFHNEEVLDELVSRCPVAHGRVANNRLDSGTDQASDDFWVVTKPEDINRVAQDHELFSSTRGGCVVVRPEGMLRQGVNEEDPPFHTSARRALNPYLTPAVVKGWEDKIRAVANEIIDDFADTGACDAFGQFASMFPIRFFFKDVLSIHSADKLERLLYFAEAMKGGQPGAGDELARLLGEQLELRAAGGPQGDMLDAILDLQHDGEDVDFDTKKRVLATVVSGGLDTTSKVLGRSLHYLAENPQQRRRLIENPEDMPLFVEEALRLFTPVWYLGRTATAEVEIGDRTIGAGDFVLMAFGAANRDPDTYEDPTTFNMDRPVQRHLTFGSGRHRCVGSHLARLQLSVALEEFLARIPDFSVAPDAEIVYTAMYINRKVPPIPLVFPVRVPA